MGVVCLRVSVLRYEINERYVTCSSIKKEKKKKSNIDQSCKEKMSREKIDIQMKSTYDFSLFFDIAYVVSTLIY